MNLVLIGVFVEVIVFLIAFSMFLVKKIRELRLEVKRLTKLTDEQRIIIRDQRQIIQTLDKKKEVPEHELQGEYEADENTYNQIIQEWIYGEVKEDGESSENN